VPLAEITQKLDTDFLAGRWGKLTDRQRELVACISAHDSEGDEFPVQEIVEALSARLEKGLSTSHTNQMLAALANAGLAYKNRHGKYSFAVPLFGAFVRCQGLLG
jgi:DNA-binding IclR family transcriptional regulator